MLEVALGIVLVIVILNLLPALIPVVVLCIAIGGPFLLFYWLVDGPPIHSIAGIVVVVFLYGFLEGFYSDFFNKSKSEKAK